MAVRCVKLFERAFVKVQSLRTAQLGDKWAVEVFRSALAAAKGVR
jgi:hypothetical protein